RRGRPSPGSRSGRPTVLSAYAARAAVLARAALCLTRVAWLLGAIRSSAASPDASAMVGVSLSTARPGRLRFRRVELPRRIVDRTGEFLLFAVTPPRLTTGPGKSR